MLKKFYSEMKYGKGYVLVYLMENYRDDMQQIIELRKKIKKDFPKVKDNQIMVKTMDSNESNSCAGYTSLRFKVEKISNMEEFSVILPQLNIESAYQITDESAEIKKYWSKVKWGGYVVRYVIKESHRTDFEYLMTLMEAVKLDYPEIKEKDISAQKINYLYSKELEGVTCLEFRTSRVNFFEVDKFPINE